MQEADLRKEIEAKVRVIESILKNGNSAEIKRNTDGSVKVYEVEKKKR